MDEIIRVRIEKLFISELRLGDKHNKNLSRRFKILLPLPCLSFFLVNNFSVIDNISFKYQYRTRSSIYPLITGTRTHTQNCHHYYNFPELTIDTFKFLTYFRSNQLQTSFLPFLFVTDDGHDFRIISSKWNITIPLISSTTHSK